LNFLKRSHLSPPTITTRPLEIDSVETEWDLRDVCFVRRV
jgi:hypothetical protein